MWAAMIFFQKSEKKRKKKKKTAASVEQTINRFISPVDLAR